MVASPATAPVTMPTMLGLPNLTPLDDEPDERRGGRRDMRHGHRHAGVAAGLQGAAGVEAEPADPQHAGALPWSSTAHAAASRRWESRRAGRCTMASTSAETPAVMCTTMPPAKSSTPRCGKPAAAPNPMRHRHIDEEQPQHREQQHRAEPHALGKGADDQRRRDDGEGHLEHEEHGLGDLGVRDRPHRAPRRAARPCRDCRARRPSPLKVRL